MKICVCSDSHGNSAGILQMLRTESPDGLIFLGDGWTDIANVPDSVFVHAVAGNCDLVCPYPGELLLSFYARCILVTHGHAQRVKQGLTKLAEYAAQKGASVALYGHTHAAGDREAGGVLMINPGAMRPREERYVVLTGDGGGMRFEYKTVRW